MVFPTAAGGLSPYGAGMDASSVFEVGSITKTFTATVLSEIGLSVARPTEPLRRSGSCTDPRRRPIGGRVCLEVRCARTVTACCLRGRNSPGAAYYVLTSAGIVLALGLILATFPLLRRITGPETARTE